MDIKTFSLQLVFRHQDPLLLPLSHLGCTYLLIYHSHSSQQYFLLFGHILYFSKTLSPKIFSSYYLSLPRTIKWQPRSYRCWAACLSPFIYCRVFAKSRVAVEGQVEWWGAWGVEESMKMMMSKIPKLSKMIYIFWQTLWSKVLPKFRWWWWARYY